MKFRSAAVSCHIEVCYPFYWKADNASARIMTTVRYCAQSWTGIIEARIERLADRGEIEAPLRSVLDN